MSYRCTLFDMSIDNSTEFKVWEFSHKRPHVLLHNLSYIILRKYRKLRGIKTFALIYDFPETDYSPENPNK